MVYKTKLTYRETIDILDIKNIVHQKEWAYHPENMKRVIFSQFTLENLLPSGVTINVTIDDIRLRSNLNKNQTLVFNQKFCFFYTILGFITSNSVPLNNPPRGVIRNIPGTYKSETLINNAGIDEDHLKCDCINGSNVNGIRELFSYRFALDNPSEHKTFKTPRIKRF